MTHPKLRIYNEKLKRYFRFKRGGILFWSWDPTDAPRYDNKYQAERVITDCKLEDCKIIPAV